MRIAASNCVFVTIVLAGVSHAQNSLPATRPTVALAVELEDDLSAILRITLTNNTPKPIVVDKQLVFLLHVAFYDATDRLRVYDAGPATRPSDIHERFISLATGESVTRIIDLNKPFKTWSAISALVRTPDGMRVHIPLAGEGMTRMPNLRSVRRITVTYQADRDDYSGFAAYTGTKLEDLHVFTGTLEQTVSGTPMPEIDEDGNFREPTTKPDQR